MRDGLEPYGVPSLSCGENRVGSSSACSSGTTQSRDCDAPWVWHLFAALLKCSGDRKRRQRINATAEKHKATVEMCHSTYYVYTYTVPDGTVVGTGESCSL